MPGASRTLPVRLIALRTAAFDATHPVALGRFFREFPPIDQVMETKGRPYYGQLADIDLAKVALLSANIFCWHFTSRAARLTPCDREKH
jgi:hypothetical protein